MDHGLWTIDPINELTHHRYRFFQVRRRRDVWCRAKNYSGTEPTPLMKIIFVPGPCAVYWWKMKA